MLDLGPIKKRCDKATVGPWRPKISATRSIGMGCGSYVESRGGGIWVDGPPSVCNYADADFIAHARSDMPALIAEIQTLRQTGNEMKCRVGTIAYHVTNSSQKMVVISNDQRNPIGHHLHLCSWITPNGVYFEKFFKECELKGDE